MEYLPPGSDRHEAAYNTTSGMTVFELALNLKIPEKLTHLVVINGITLDLEEIRSQEILEGDTVAIFPPVAGG